MSLDMSEKSFEENDRAAAVLKRLLATPPDHRTKPKSDASPKKRGRPPKRDVANKE
jgi:hypothetical protein